MTYAIPTKWNGVQFRSRLEARWAAFFTAIGWEWSYEPVDLQGYIPDFLLHLHEDVLVEVKPFTRLDDAVIEAAHAKIRESGWGGGDAIVVGARLFDHRDIDALVIGALNWEGEEMDEDLKELMGPVGWSANEALLGECITCGKVSFASYTQSYHCRVCGVNVGDIPSFRSVEQRKRVFGAWNEAGNAVQWRRRA